MMEDIDKDELQEQLQDMDMSNEELEKELDRALGCSSNKWSGK